MNVRMRRRVAALLLLLALLLPQAVQADSASITCYGEDLTSEQYTLVLDLLEADPATDTLIPVTHEDEVSLLGDIVPAEKIGSRSLSSARMYTFSARSSRSSCSGSCCRASALRCG